MLKFSDFLAESFQQGGPKAPRSKEEELEVAKQSPIFRKTQFQGWSFDVTIHAAAQAYDRRPEFEFDDWKKLHRNALMGLMKGKDAKSGDYIFHSKSLDQAYVAAVDVRRKTFKIVTVLPKGRSNPKPGTERMMVEGVEIEAVFIEVD